MNSILEERILSMKFNNEQFEKNIQKSTESIKALDKTINDSTANINRNISKLDFGGSSMANIERSLQHISSRFSTMGIVGMNVINQLTNAAINMGKQIWGATFGQIKAGGMKRALNIEQAEFLLEGLGLDVAQIKEDAMYAVEGTAYGFDEAARAASSFGASGVKAGEDMKEALLGVSGVAAMTGRDYQSIADIFTTIASNGKLMTMQLRQFSASGLNVSAAMAKYLGKTEAEINEMVTKGQIDFATFAKAMNETFGEHAKDANKTFNGSMSNMKAALSRIGEAFATPYIENMIPIFNKLKDVINDVKKALGPLIDDSAKLMKILSDFAVGALDKLQNSGAIVDIMYGLRHIFLGFVGVIAALSKAIKETFPNVDGLSGLFRNLTLRLVPTRESFEKLVNIFKTIINAVKMVAAVVGNVVSFVIRVVPQVINVVKTAAFVLFSIFLKIKDTLSNMVFFQSVFNTISKIINGLKMGFFVIFSLIVKLKDGISAVLADERVQAFLAGLKDTAVKVFSVLSTVIKELDVRFGALAGTIAVVAFGILTFKGVMKAAVKPLEVIFNLGRSIVGVFTSLGNFFNSGASMFKGIKDFMDAMKEAQRQNIAATIILKLAAGIAILAVSLKLLSTIPWNDLLVGVGVILLLMAALSIFGKMLNELDSDKRSARGVLALAVAVGILAIATKSLSQLTWDQWAVAAASMGTIVTFVVAVQWISGKLENPMVVTGLWTLSFCINLLTIAFKSLGNMDWGQYAHAVAGMSTILALVTIFEAITGKLIKDAMVVKGLWTLSICINLLTIAFKSLGNMDWGQYAHAVAGMSTILALVTIFEAITGKLIKDAMVVKGLWTLSICINLLTIAFKSLGNMDWGQYAHAVAGMSTIFGLLMIFEAITGLLIKNPMVVKGLWTLSICINLLTLAFTTLGNMDWGQYARAVAGMGTLMALVMAFEAITGLLIKNSMVVKGLWTLSICINLLSLAFTSLGKLSWDEVTAASIGMLVLLGFISSLMAISKALNKDSGVQGLLNKGIQTKGLLSLTIAVTILTGCFRKLGEMSLEQIGVAVLGLAAIEVFILSIQALSKNLNGVKTKGLIKIAVVAAVLVTVMSILYKITQLPMNDILVAAASVAAVLLALSLALKLISGSVFGGSFDIKMMLVLAGAIGILVASAYALQIVADVPSEDIVAASVAISALFLALGLGLKLMNGATGWAALLAASVALIAIAGALKIVASIPAENLIPAAIALGAVLGALVLFGALVATLPVIGAALLAITGAMLGFSVAAIGFGAAMLLISASFETFVNALVNLSSLTSDNVNQVISNMVQFVTGLGDVAVALAAQAPKFAIALSAIFGVIITALGNVRIQIANTVINVVVTIIQKLTEAFPLLLEAFGEMLIEISEWFEAHENEIEEIGFNIGKGLAKGIIAGLAGASEAIYETIDDTFVHSANSDRAIQEAAQQQAQTYADALTKWFDYYDAGTVTADQLIEGMRIGLTNGMYTQEEVMRELAQRGLEGYQDELGIHSPSLEMIENGEYTIAGVIEGIHNGEYTFEQVMAALGKNGCSAFMSQFTGITDLMNTLNGAGAQAAGSTDWRAIGSSYEDERGYTKSMQRWQQEGFRSLDEFVEHHQTAEFEEMLGEWGYHAEETADAEEDLTEQTEELNNSLAGTGGLSESASKATKETDKLKDSIKSALDIFSGFDVQLDMTSKDVLKSFSDQLVGVQAWSKELEALAGRGIAKELLNELAEAGPSALNRIHALYSMSESQLSLFNKMYEQKLSLEKSTADEIRASFGQVGDKSGEEVGQAIGNGIAEGTKEGVEQATTYVEQFVDDGQKAGDIIRYDDRGFALTKALPRFRYEGYETATAWEEAHRKACTKMVPVIANTYSKVGEAASESVKEAVEGTTDTVLNEMEQGVIDAHKIGAEYEYVNGVIIPNSIKDSIKEATPGVAAIFGEMGYQSMEAFEHMLNVEDAISMVEMFQAGLEDSITSSLKLFDEVKEKEDISAEEMLKRMKENVKNIGKWANDLQTLASRGISEGLLNELQALGPEGADKVHAFTKMTDAQLQQANNAFAASAALPKQVSDRITKSYAEAGFNTTLGFVEGIDPTAAEEVMTALGTYSLAALKESLDIHSPSGKMMEAGMYTVAGLVQGITDGLAKVTEVGAEMGSALISSVLAAPEVISEKVTEFFTHLGDIFVGGIKKFGESEAMITFRNTVVDMLNMSLDDILIEPTIRPVIDFESMGDSLGVINGMFNRGFNISPAVGKADNAFGANKTDYTGYLKDMTNLLKQTNEEVAGIRTDVNRLDRDMAELTVNLDGYSVGKLVSPYVNRNLGQTYVNNKRRTM